MDDAKFKKKYRKMGLGCFVRDYETFADSTIPQVDVISYLVLRRAYTKNASATRVSCARLIISAGRAADTLRAFLSSKIDAPDLRKKARLILCDLDPHSA